MNPSWSPAWHAPRSRAEAVELLRHGATPVGGGAALLSRAFPHSAGSAVVDLRAAVDAGSTPPVVGAGATIASLAADPALLAGWPAVAQAAGLTANPGIRRIATIGGTVAGRIPTADLAAPLAVHAAVVLLETGVRPGPARLPYLEYLAQAATLGPHLVTGLDLGAPARGAYRRIAGRHGPAPALATVAGVIDREGRVLLCAGACAPMPLLFTPGELPGPDQLLDDDRASALYRSRLLSVLADEVVEALS
ncbi:MULTISPECIES: FAD binding domain-containing protein [unclassified Modestobacter]|uniref:FAD binding domain-containing protein n=1 Tax=unclassified Modestobacter TaxID=2643866 RepID=UPI0022AA35E3|nr:MULTISPECIES: FAD binding domain-containing protein [unclassified Modestobacter]MCZ2825036.1 FAD binding domain-containing protein [Modestobacter sp. VKM Ac-2981]MCZ2854461.1 FAD binding domain-containing protein [Modestobacter sp. VKM Ac-2982]